MVGSADIVEVIGSALLFLFVWQFLARHLFRPYLSLLEEREKRTVGAAYQAERHAAELRALEEEIDQRLHQARLRGITVRDRHLRVAKSQAQEITNSAMAKAERDLAEARRDIERLSEEAEASLGGEVETVSRLVREKALSNVGNRVLH